MLELLRGQVVGKKSTGITCWKAITLIKTSVTYLVKLSPGIPWKADDVLTESGKRKNVGVFNEFLPMLVMLVGLQR